MPALGIAQGDKVEVVDGPFQEFEGKVVSEEAGKRIQVELDIFGRPTTVEVDSQMLKKKE